MPKVIVIGAGFGGIAASLRLKKKGYDVEIVDQCLDIGGRAQVYESQGYKFDAGPTVLTATFLFDELFKLFGKNIDDYITIKPLNAINIEVPRSGWLKTNNIGIIKIIIGISKFFNVFTLEICIR